MENENKLGDSCDAFFVKIVEQNGVLRVTIPKRITDFMGWKEQDEVRVIVQKVIFKKEE